MPIPFLAAGIGLAGRLLVGSGARAGISRAVGAAMTSSSRSVHAAPATRASIKQASQDAISNAVQQRAEKVAAGVAGYHAATNAAESAGAFLKNATGYAIKKADFEAQLAGVGLGHMLGAINDEVGVASSRIAQDISSGENFSDIHEILNRRVGVSMRFNRATADVRAKAVSQWTRYGYMVNRPMVPPRLDPMDRFSYWKMRMCTVLGPMPQDARMDIQAAFERGTTVWNNVGEIGTKPNNNPRNGVSY